MKGSSISSLTPFLWMLVLFGLLPIPGVRSGDGLKRKRRREVQEARPRNTYWDLPPKEKWSSTRANNPYWKLPQEEGQGRTTTIQVSGSVNLHHHDATRTEEKSSSSTIQVEGQVEVEEQQTNEGHAVVAEEKSSASTIPQASAQERLDEASFQNDVMLMNQNLFVRQCMNLLESHADENNQLDRDRYVDFLRDISNDTLDSQGFTDLPLFLAMIFFSASCARGQDCITQEPAITIHTPLGTSPENAMNQVLCHQLMRFPFMEILLPFQFLIRVRSGLSASQLMLVSEETSSTGNEEDDTTSRIVPNLEGALDQVLLKGFNCSYVPGEPIASSSKNSRRKKTPPRERSQNRQPQPQGDCDFVVQVTIEDAADYPCGFRSSCILIFSDVTVYAVLKDTLDEPTLRKMTSDVLRNAINGNALSDFL